MKKVLPFLTITGILLAIIILAGRPAEVVPSTAPTSLPDDLDAYLGESESQYEDLISAANKTIVWADSAKSKTPLSIVYIHGFSATRQETAPLSDTLADRWGANLFYTRLTGHGRSDDAMGEASATDWLDDATEALEIGRRIGERVVLVGTSTGGTLATWLASRAEPLDIAAVILISPNFWPQAEGARMLLWPYGGLIGRAVEGEYVESEAVNEGHAMYWTNRYPLSAVVEMMRLVKFVDEIDLSTLNIPTLIIYSPEDKVVDPDYITAAFEEIGSEKKQIIAVDDVEAENKHVLAGTILSPKNTEQVARYIETFISEL